MFNSIQLSQRHGIKYSHLVVFDVDTLVFLMLYI